MEDNQKNRSRKVKDATTKSQDFSVDSESALAKGRKETAPFKPKTFTEFWTRAEKNLYKTSASSGNFNRDKYTKKKKELRAIAKDLWYENADKRKRLYEDM